MKTVTETIMMISSEREKEIADFLRIPIISLYDARWVTASDYKDIKEILKEERRENAEFWVQMAFE